MQDIDSISLDVQEGENARSLHIGAGAADTPDEAALICGIFGHKHARDIAIPDKFNQTLIGACLCGERAHPKSPRHAQTLQEEVAR